MPITLGILAQSRQAVAASDFVLLETTVVGSGGAANVTFSNLNSTYGSTYKHLQVRYTVRTTASEVLSGVRVRLGTTAVDETSAYSRHQLYGYNGSVTSFGEGTQTSMFAGVGAGANAASNIFGAGVIDILDPFVTTKNKTIRTLAGAPAGTGTNAFVTLESGAWFNTGATQLLRVLPSSGNFVEHSRFSLYGVK